MASAEDVPDGDRATTGLLAFGPLEEELAAGYAAVRNLSPSGDLTEAAANFFAHLRALDAAPGTTQLAATPLPDHGLGRALTERLARAAAS